MASRRPGRLVTLAAGLVGGLALTASFPSMSIWPLAYVGLALAFLAVQRDSWPWALLTAFVFHLAFFLPLLWWAYYSVGLVPWLALSIAESLIMALIGPIYVGLRRLLRLGTRPFLGALVFAVCYVGLEEVRSAWPFGGFPWGRLAFSQSDAWAAPLAFLGGMPLLSMAVAFVGALAAGVYLAALRPTREPAAQPAGEIEMQPAGETVVSLAGEPEAQRAGEPVTQPGEPEVSHAQGAAGAERGPHAPASRHWLWHRHWRTVAAGAAVIVVVAVAPLLVPLPSGASDGTLRVGAVQGNIADSSHGAETRMRGVTQNHVTGTEQLAAEVGAGSLDIVLWPENAADISPRADAEVAAEINRAAKAAGAPILVGSIEYLPDKTRKNVSLLWWPGRGVIDEYAKQHPAPFAEYIPMRSIAAKFSDKVNLVTNEMVPGTDPATIDLPVPRLDRDVVLADVICFEVAYDAIVRQGVDLGGELIVVQTNNASFGMTAEGAQQLAMTRLRAIEHGRSAVQISTVGLSALIAPNGKVLQEGGLFTAEQFHDVLPLRTSISPASRISPALTLATMLCAGLAALGAIGGVIVNRRKHP